MSHTPKPLSSACRRHFVLDDPSATLALGARFAAHLQIGDSVLLYGELGAGKTTFVRGLIQALMGQTEVPSPTYTLVQVYDTDIGEVWHGDMYRLERPQDCEELGLPDAFDDAICLIEWPDKLGDYAPQDALMLELEFDGDARRATLSGARDWITDV